MKNKYDFGQKLRVEKRILSEKSSGETRMAVTKETENKEAKKEKDTAAPQKRHKDSTVVKRRLVEEPKKGVSSAGKKKNTKKKTAENNKNSGGSKQNAAKKSTSKPKTKKNTTKPEKEQKAKNEPLQNEEAVVNAAVEIAAETVVSETVETAEKTAEPAVETVVEATEKTAGAVDEAVAESVAEAHEKAAEIIAETPEKTEPEQTAAAAVPAKAEEKPKKAPAKKNTKKKSTSKSKKTSEKISVDEILSDVEEAGKPKSKRKSSSKKPKKDKTEKAENKEEAAVTELAAEAAAEEKPEQAVVPAVIEEHAQTEEVSAEETEKAPETAAEAVETESVEAPEQAEETSTEEATETPETTEVHTAETVETAETAESKGVEVPEQTEEISAGPEQSEETPVEEAAETPETSEEPAAETTETETEASEPAQGEETPAEEEGEEPAADTAESETAQTESAVAVVQKDEPQPDVELKETSSVSEETPKKKSKALKTVIAVAAALLLCFGGVILYLNGRVPVIDSAQLEPTLNENGTATLTATVSTPHFLKTELWAAATDSPEAPAADDKAWQPVDENGSCSFEVEEGALYLHALDSRGNVASASEQGITFNEVVAVTVDKEKVYLPLGGKDTVAADLFKVGEVSDVVSWSVADEAVATVDADGVVRAVAEGETALTAQSADGRIAEAAVIVTDIFKLPNYDTYSKPMLSTNPYTDEEAHLLDDILFTKVDQAGYGTRAGVVAAARFLALEFEYRVPYFFENGRLSPHEGRPKCDGEGRYYHRGLFLCECKFEELDPIRYGPATWGQPLMNWETKYAFVGGNRYPNGLDCSGFVAWCLINGGVDVGDMGAGNEYGNNDLCDLGEMKWITTSLMQSDEIQVGDLIAEDGHMAIIIGLTEDRIYIAESLFTSVRVTNFPRTSAVLGGPYAYVIPMGDVYEADGNLTTIWDMSHEETA